MSGQVEAVYPIEYVIENWINRSRDSYGPEYTDPSDGWLLFTFDEDGARVSIAYDGADPTGVYLSRYKDE